MLGPVSHEHMPTSLLLHSCFERWWQREKMRHYVEWPICPVRVIFLGLLLLERAVTPELQEDAEGGSVGFRGIVNQHCGRQQCRLCVWGGWITTVSAADSKARHYIAYRFVRCILSLQLDTPYMAHQHQPCFYPSVEYIASQLVHIAHMVCISATEDQAHWKGFLQLQEEHE